MSETSIKKNKKGIQLLKYVIIASFGVFVGHTMSPTFSYWGLVLEHGPILTKIDEECMKDLKYKEIWVGPEYSRRKIAGE